MPVLNILDGTGIKAQIQKILQIKQEFLKEHCFIISRIKKVFKYKNIDTTKFKKDVNPKQIYQMMLWMSEGYINEKKRMNTPIILEDFLADFKTWEILMKKACYEEDI